MGSFEINHRDFSPAMGEARLLEGHFQECVVDCLVPVGCVAPFACEVVLSLLRPRPNKTQILKMDLATPNLHVNLGLRIPSSLEELLMGWIS